MEKYEIHIIETIISIIILTLLIYLIHYLIDSAGKKFSYQSSRIKIVKKIISFVLFSIFLGIIILIWGIAPSQLAAYLTTLFTIFGVAFLAQWSIISNITSTLIIFFNHQVNIGDTIEILDKEYQIKGKISDIGIFFIIIKTTENEYVSIPSNVFMLKMVKKIK